MSQTRKRAWTVAQHSGYGYGGNPEFEHGLEVRELGVHGEPFARELGRVEAAGGIVFDSLADAAEFEHRAPYPDGYEGLIPRAAGSFSDRTIDGLRIYVPVRQVLG